MAGVHRGNLIQKIAPITAAKCHPITAEHDSIKVMCTQQTSLPEEDWQCAVETLRTTSKGDHIMRQMNIFLF